MAEEGQQGGYVVVQRWWWAWSVVITCWDHFQFYKCYEGYKLDVGRKREESMMTVMQTTGIHLV